jgi:hypothetical protein
VLVSRPLVGGGGGVAAEHGLRPPAGQAHEAAFGAAGVEEGVGERVAELDGVDVGEPGGLGPLADHLGDTPGAHRAVDPEPQRPFQLQVDLDSLRRPVGRPQRPFPQPDVNPEALA